MHFLPLFITLVLCFAKNDTNAAEGAFTFTLKYFSLRFPEGNPSSCDPGEFKQIDNQLYIFSEPIDWQYAEKFECIMSSSIRDKFEFYDRYINCMALRISETEGVISFDSKQSDLGDSSLYYVSPWTKMESSSFEHYGYGKDYWKPSITGIDTNAFNKWYFYKCVSGEVSPEHGDRRTVFCYQRQVKIEYYPLHRKKKTIILIFNHKDGTC